MVSVYTRDNATVTIACNIMSTRKCCHVTRKISRDSENWLKLNKNDNYKNQKCPLN